MDIQLRPGAAGNSKDSIRLIVGVGHLISG